MVEALPLCDAISDRKWVFDFVILISQYRSWEGLNITIMILKRFLDNKGKVAIYPSKLRSKHIVLEYLSEKFDNEVVYSEAEVNEILKEHHTFEDWARLRRDLVDFKYMSRSQDGARYKLQESK